ncbi:MAG: Papain family cysteine protease, partial [Candidatus Hydrogenedentes bacterium]|nr:Papain family cysteine protease [Candidatus Hydrogenedentota bacterium]
AWREQVCNLAAVADGKPSVQVRWVMGTTNSTNSYAGWNLDDIEFRGNPLVAEGEGEGEGEPQACDIDSPANIFAMLVMIGDSDTDGAISQAEAGIYIAMVSDYWGLFDLNLDGILTQYEFTHNMLVQGFLPAVDANRDNVIALPELIVLTDIITAEMFALVDKDASGGVDCGDLGYVIEPPCPTCSPTAEVFYEVGDDACLQVPGGAVAGTEYQWSRPDVGILAEGRCQGVHCATLYLPDLDVADSATYTCVYGPQKSIYSVNVRVVSVLPAAGGLGVWIAALAVVLLAVVSAIRRNPRRA